jgi:hypothetical protein
LLMLLMSSSTTNRAVERSASSDFLSGRLWRRTVVFVGTDTGFGAALTFAVLFVVGVVVVVDTDTVVFDDTDAGVDVVVGNTVVAFAGFLRSSFTARFAALFAAFAAFVSIFAFAAAAADVACLPPTAAALPSSSSASSQSAVSSAITATAARTLRSESSSSPSANSSGMVVPPRPAFVFGCTSVVSGVVVIVVIDDDDDSDGGRSNEHDREWFRGERDPLLQRRCRRRPLRSCVGLSAIVALGAPSVDVEGGLLLPAGWCTGGANCGAASGDSSSGTVAELKVCDAKPPPVSIGGGS